MRYTYYNDYYHHSDRKVKLHPLNKMSNFHNGSMLPIKGKQIGRFQFFSFVFNFCFKEKRRIVKILMLTKYCQGIRAFCLSSIGAHSLQLSTNRWCEWIKFECNEIDEMPWILNDLNGYYDIPFQCLIAYLKRVRHHNLHNKRCTHLIIAI